MGLPFSLAITLILAQVFYYQKKRLSFLQNTILFMILTILISNFLTITTLEMKWIKSTDDPFLFIVISLYRDGILPILILIFINYFVTPNSAINKILIFSLFLICCLGIDSLLIFFGVLTYINWNLFLSLLVNSAYFFITLSLVKIFLQKEHLHDNSL